MPELPEVEVVRRGLESHVVGSRVRAVEVLHPRAVRRHLAGPDDFVARLTGREITAARRRGKYLWLPVDDEDAVLAHLGMSGQMLVQSPAAPPDRHLRVLLTMSDGAQLRFCDQRMFGGLALSEGGAQLPAEVAHIARDPLDPAFDSEAWLTAMRRRRTGIKRALLDQTLVSGIGNIYADEALWHARLHYARPTETLRRPEALRLLAAVRAVMLAALEEGGTSFDALYVNVNGDSGYFGRSLQVYGQAQAPCTRCGTPIRRDSFMNRSAFSCPTCQPRPRRARW
ncbi:MAG TPA: bifunctional DNA-formamidopyrimidine glycosylase/DNA-(apurinic or apyrimidinic site) lyase [Nocardioidaceae bacterium]|nr:bifunctional DNA-formamidopyrimidine glycosylase/DNA-(apurinic or apyrimidinic site) lyase [Nocardioidaceae bacterium]